MEAVKFIATVGNLKNTIYIGQAGLLQRYNILFLPRPKVGLKKFYRCSFEPGVIFENQKLREIFVSEATESCKGSKWGFFGVPSTTRLFPGG